MKNMKSREETKSVSRLNYFQNIKKMLNKEKGIEIFSEAYR